MIYVSAIPPRTGKPKEGERVPAEGCCDECGRTVGCTVLRSPVDGDIDPRMERSVAHDVGCSFHRHPTGAITLTDRVGSAVAVPTYAGDGPQDIAGRINASPSPARASVRAQAKARRKGRR